MWYMRLTISCLSRDMWDVSFARDNCSGITNTFAWPEMWEFPSQCLVTQPCREMRYPRLDREPSGCLKRTSGLWRIPHHASCDMKVMLLDWQIFSKSHISHPTAEAIVTSVQDFPTSITAHDQNTDDIGYGSVGFNVGNKCDPYIWTSLYRGIPM